MKQNDVSSAEAADYFAILGMLDEVAPADIKPEVRLLSEPVKKEGSWTAHAITATE